MALFFTAKTGLQRAEAVSPHASHSDGISTTRTAFAT